MKDFKSKASKASEYTLKEEEVKAIINATKTTRDKIIVELLAYTGCRRKELCLLRFKDIDLEHVKIFMPTAKQKTNPYNNLREIPIINAELLRDIHTYIETTKIKYKWLGKEDLLLQSRNNKAKGITPTMISIIVRDTSKRAGIKSPNPSRKWIQPHIFRHTFIRLAKKYGLDYVVIQKIAGHKSLSTTMGMYGEPSWEDKVEELNKLKTFGNGV